MERGERLEKPKFCPDKIYAIMRKCWNMDADLRPKFTFLENFFANPALDSIPSSSLTHLDLQPSSDTPPEDAPPPPPQNDNDSANFIDFNDNDDATYTNTIERGRSSSSREPQNDLNRSLESLQLIKWD